MEEKGNYNSNKTKLIAKDIWSEEIPAVVEKKLLWFVGLMEYSKVYLIE